MGADRGAHAVPSHARREEVRRMDAYPKSLDLYEVLICEHKDGCWFGVLQTTCYPASLYAGAYREIR